MYFIDFQAIQAKPSPKLYQTARIKEFSDSFFNMSEVVFCNSKNNKCQLSMT